MAIVVFFELSCLFYPSCSKKKYYQCFCPMRRRPKTFLSFQTPTKLIYHSIVSCNTYIRILQSTYICKSIQINQIKSIMSYPVITLAMPFFLQDCYKNRVSFWCSLTTILCIFFFQNNFNQNSKQLKLNLFLKHFKFTLIGIKLLLMSKFH